MKHFKEADMRLMELQDMLAALESGKNTTPEFKGSISNQLPIVRACIEKTEKSLTNVPPHLRRVNKIRVMDMYRSYHDMQAAFDNVMARSRRLEQEERERQELLAMRFSPNNNETTIMIDHALQETQKLSGVSHHLDEMLGAGYDILDDLRHQRSTLKRAKRKMLDILNTLGLSNTVMRLIDRRVAGDKLVLWGGMAITLFIMYIVVQYLT